MQYADIRRRYVTGPTVKVGEEKDMSAVYGAEHLLRMIGSSFISYYSWYMLEYLIIAPVSESSGYDWSIEHGPRVGDRVARICAGTDEVRPIFGLNPFKASHHSSSFMVEEKDRIFQREYETTSTHYQNVSKS